MSKLFLGLIITVCLSLGADDIKELEKDFRRDPYNPENAYEFAKSLCLAKDGRCEDAISYAVALEPNLVDDAVTFLKELGYDINSELMKRMAFEQIIKTLEVEKRMYRFERPGMSDEEILQKIISKPPFIFFKNPWTGKRITIEDLNSSR